MIWSIRPYDISSSQSKSSSKQAPKTRFFVMHHRMDYHDRWLDLERSEVLRNLRHYLRAQTKDIIPSEERGVERGSARRSSWKGREKAIVNQTNIGTVLKATLGKVLRDGIERTCAHTHTHTYTHTHTHTHTHTRLGTHSHGIRIDTRMFVNTQAHTPKVTTSFFCGFIWLFWYIIFLIDLYAILGDNRNVVLIFYTERSILS